LDAAELLLANSANPKSKTLGSVVCMECTQKVTANHPTRATLNAALQPSPKYSFGQKAEDKTKGLIANAG
jgi:hypothetical protein